MDILITGSSGFIGSHLLKRLKDIIDKDGGSIKHSLNIIDRKIGRDLLEEKTFKDIGEWEEVMGSPEYIFHLAGQTSIVDSFKDPIQDAKDNILTILQLIEHYPKAKIIYTNSVASCDPKNPYGLSKRTAEDYLKMLHIDYVICNLPNVFGDGGKGIIDIIKNNEEVTIYGKGNQQRTFVSVDDIVEGLIKAMKWEKGEYFLGTPFIYDINTLVKKANKKVIKKPKIVGDIEKSIINNTTPDWVAKIDPIKYLCN